MTKEAKLIAKIESIPHRSDITYEEFQKYLYINGFEMVRHDGTSHMTYKHKAHGDMLTVAYHGKHVKVYSIRQAIEIIREHKEDK